MKIRDTAMGKWFEQQTPEYAVAYVTHCLYTGHENVFWDVVKAYDLRAPSPQDLGAQVVERLMDFDPDASPEEEP